jgi:hypothetical protein
MQKPLTMANYKTQIQKVINDLNELTALLNEISEETPSDKEANDAQNAIIFIMKTNEYLEKLCR